MSKYGYCPQCGAPGVSRERRPNGRDTCARHHQYFSSEALKEPMKPHRERVVTTTTREYTFTEAEINALLKNAAGVPINTPDSQLSVTYELDTGGDGIYSATLVWTQKEAT